MANKNLIRRMRQLLILVLILAMTMSFATMTAMAVKPDKPSDPHPKTSAYLADQSASPPNQLPA